MFPVIHWIPGIPLPSYHIFFFFAVVAAYAFARSLARSLGLASLQQRLPLIFLLTYPSGWIGARGFALLFEEEGSASVSFLSLFQVGPMTFYGGALVGGMVAVLSLLLLGIPLRKAADSLIPAVILGLGVGRVGCFLNGCDFGRPISGSVPWWAHANPVLGDGVVRYPTQIEESLFSLGLAVVVWVVGRRRDWRLRWALRHGDLAAGALLLTTANRFLNEFFRGDERGSWGSWPPSQVIAGGLFFVALGAIIHSRRTKFGNVAD